MLSYYNIRYTYMLFVEMGEHVTFRNGVRGKIVSIACLIEVCLVLHFFWIWMANYFWWSQHGARDYLTFEIVYFVLSELIPFLIFCVVLTIRIQGYSRDYKMMKQQQQVDSSPHRSMSDESNSAMMK